ncbi:VanZ family protein [Iodobacter fluviatilis]|uniref:VanZ family protein n=1 Tax=Iodobacter fluviatilis TaxID=537 RepID=A0A7G3G7L4_9NEIS|nr:VanZ family protein [Iodobacter fluviatilis]QBC43023.1 VanZ family protein [Iodobacter fluviatilis]
MRNISFNISYLARRITPSRVPRYVFFCSVLVILVVSLYPFTGWRFTGEPIWAFYAYPLPYYFTFFDNSINVLAYMPLGFSLAISLKNNRLGPLLAQFSGVLLSCMVEFTQQFLPGRVASNLDILSNSFGAFLGVLLAMILGNRYWQTRCLAARHAWFAPGPAVEWGVTWLVLWFLTQMDPSQPFLGVVVESPGLPQPFESPMENAKLFLRLLEGGGMMLHFLGVALFVSVLMRHTRQSPAAIRFTLLTALLLKLGFAGVLLKPAQFFAWLNFNIFVGGLLGTLALLLLWRLNRGLRALLGALALAATLVIGWFWPLVPQLAATLPLFRWHYGHLLHFNGLSAVISDVWPYGAIALLLWLAARPPREESW